MPDVFQEVAACVEVAIKAEYVGYGSELVNVLNFQTPTATPNGADVEACVEMVKDWVNNVYLDMFSQDIRVKRLEGKSRAASVAPFFNLEMDTLGTEWVLDEVAHAPLVLLHGPLSSRHQAGKCYTFAPQLGIATGSGYTAIHRANLVLAFNILKATGQSEGYPLAVASKESRVAFPVGSITTSPRLTMMTTRRPNFGE
jgi:hypothetical protein